MNREILFKGFHPCENGKDRVFINGEWINGEWIEGYYWKDIWGDNIEYIYYDGEDYEVIPETVGQYTDLTDKNDKKIFEGDIVVDKYATEKFGFVGCVQYNPNKTNFEIYNPKSPDIWVNLGSRQDSVKVIGNIHDNPELLEVAK